MTIGTICVEDLQQNDRVCRLRCGHAYHANCWSSFQDAHQHQSSAIACPNCRGSNTVIAVWHRIDSHRITQEVGNQVAENLLHQQSAQQQQFMPEVGGQMAEGMDASMEPHTDEWARPTNTKRIWQRCLPQWPCIFVGHVLTSLPHLNEAGRWKALHHHTPRFCWEPAR